MCHYVLHILKIWTRTINLNSADYTKYFETELEPQLRHEKKLERKTYRNFTKIRRAVQNRSKNLYIYGQHYTYTSFHLLDFLQSYTQLVNNSFE